jgi:hypothetical protein
MTRHRNIAATLAAGWSAFFAAAHLYWASGGTGLAPRTQLPVHGLTLTVDVLAIPVCLVGAGLAWQLRAARYRRWLFVLCSSGAALMLWHAGLNYLFLGVRSILGQPLTDDDRYYALVYEPFWMLGGALWGWAVLRYRSAGTAGHAMRSVQPHSMIARWPDPEISELSSGSR